MEKERTMPPVCFLFFVENSIYTFDRMAKHCGHGRRNRIVEFNTFFLVMSQNKAAQL